MKSMQHARAAQSAGPRSLKPWLVRAVTLLLSCTCWCGTTAAESPSLVRISNGDEVYTGCIVARTLGGYLLMDRQGRMTELDPQKFRHVQKLPSPFQAESSSEFRRELIREFGRDYEVQGSTHYLVCAPKGSAGEYANFFEEIYRDVDKFYRKQGFRVKTPQIPLVSIVFGSQEEFVQYCRKDSVTPKPGLMGYYSLMTNRVALYEGQPSYRTSAIGPHSEAQTERESSIAALAATGGRTASTIIHETTHQVSYNLGIHSRFGGTPQWLTEGLATALEPDGMRRNRAAGERINLERRDWFRDTYWPRRPQDGLARLVASDQSFQQNTLDAYSESWALTYFLMDTSTRRRAFSRYLQRIAARKAGSSYTEKERLADFEAEFGDLARLEVQFVRFMEEL